VDDPLWRIISLEDESMSDAVEPRRRVAVLGSGLGSLSTVMALTDQPDWQDRYEITVYQMGWRLGGKGASGRNAAKGQRIEEHGLHVWMGCYHNAFEMIKSAYGECKEYHLTPTSPFQDWTDAFKPNSLVTVMDHFDGAWTPWTVVFPTNDEVPGTGGLWLTPWDYLKELLGFMVDRVEAAGHSLVRDFLEAHKGHTIRGWVLGVIEGVREVVAAAVEVAEQPLTFLHRARDLADSLDPDPHHHTAGQHGAIVSLVDSFLKVFFGTIEKDVATSLELHRLWTLLDLAGAMVKGMIRDGVLYSGLDVLDKYDFMEWLRANGATEEHSQSAPVRGIYDLIFAYERGDERRPNLAAGVAMRICLRVTMGYRGSIIYRMQAAMGDTVFTPLYKALKHRGVKFRFFHRVEQLRLSPDGQYIEAIDLGIQATLAEQAKQANPGGEYAPLTPPLHGLECWPSLPLYGQLVQGQALEQGGYDLESAWTTWQDVGKLSLQRGQDFDLVVLGISIGALPYISGELSKANPAWQGMLDGVKTVQTEACQVWGNHDSQAMGWDAAQPNIWAAYPWSGADMSELIRMENWPDADDVRNISYYCRQLPDAAHMPPPGPDPEFPRSQGERVKQDAIAFLTTQIAPIWPKAVSVGDPRSINWDWVVDPENRPGEQRFNYQYRRANIDPTERYVMSVTDSTHDRLTSETCGFLNLYIAGDWTLNGFNAGCVEAAVTSGLMACRAICGSPRTIVGEPWPQS
jgi:uncharacterized protein with NAD-binding domain and iron-sulfur cluster